MNASLFRIARRLRSSLRTALVAVVLVSATTALALGIAAGAHRTSTAPARYEQKRPAQFQATVMQSAGLPRAAEINRLPGVRSAAGASFVMGLLTQGDEGRDAFIFAGDPAVWTGPKINGRMPTNAREFIASDVFVNAAGASLGDRFVLRTVTNATADSLGFAGLGAPDGPQVDVTLVGEFGGRATGDPSRPLEPITVFPSSLLDLGDIAIRSTPIAVVLDPGTSVDDLARSVAGLGPGFDVTANEQISTSVRAAVSQQAASLWILDAIFVVIALALLSQVLSRAAQLTPSDERILHALGYDRTQIFAETTGWLTIVAGSGVVIGALAAAAGSGLFPTGFVRAIEPEPGLRIDLGVLSLGGVVVAILLVLLSALMLAPRVRTRSAMKPSRLVAPAGALGVNAAASTGAQLAFVRGRRDRFSVTGAVMTVALLTALLVASLTVGRSLHRLVADPAMSGAPWDMYVGGQGETSNDPAVVDSVRNVPDVVGVAALVGGAVSSTVGPVQLIGLDRVRGAIGPTVMTGRLPFSGDEIAVGRLEAARLSVGIGDEVVLTGEAGERALTVVGVIVVPSIGGNKGVGHDAVVTMEGFSALIAEPSSGGIVVEVGPSVAADSQRLLDELGAVPVRSNGLPDSIVELNHADGVPQVLGVLVALLLVIALGHLAIAVIQRRNDDVAVLASLGADRRWLAVMSHTSVSVVALVAIPLSVPAGAVVGARVFRRLADSIGGVNTATVPWGISFLIAAGAVVGANGLAALPALQARRRLPATGLMGE